MAKRTDIKKVLIIGSGPIVIGQAAEFDYAGTQACLALKEEGYEVVLVNSNPATIMTDTQIADKVYMEPLTLEYIAKISSESIERAEDRELFKEMCQSIGEPVIPSEITYSLDEAKEAAAHIGYPVVLRPAFTLGGTGGGFADNEDELVAIGTNAFRLSPVHQVLIEKSVRGYKEILKMLNDSAIRIIRELKIEGGCNVQFALNPNSSEYFLIEVNPRVSRSSALASKASGYPIARVTAKIAMGMALEEIPVAGGTAAIEPSLDYIVAKFPRFPFDKFPDAPNTLGTQMKATGEVMGIGSNLEECFLKSVRSLETGVCHLHHVKFDSWTESELLDYIAQFRDDNIYAVMELLRRGVSVEKLHEVTMITELFLVSLKKIADMEARLRSKVNDNAVLADAKRMGFSDRYIARLWNMDETELWHRRKGLGLTPVFRMVDTLHTGKYIAYLYSSYSGENQSRLTEKKKIVVLGAGPIRIGQGVEFDYSTVHAVQTIKRAGFEAIIINNNPETVSTDYTTGDKLYFEPLTPEDVMAVIDYEQPEGVIASLGGQTAINLAQPLMDRGVKIIGTDCAAIERAENRDSFEKILLDLDIPQPRGTAVTNIEDGVRAAAEIGYPVLVRPSFVLGGRAMEIVADENMLRHYLKTAVEIDTDKPVLVDKYIQGKEVEVDAICDGRDVFVPGIMELVERTGVHSGDSISVYPAFSISNRVKGIILQYAKKLGLGIGIIGLYNIQFIVDRDENVYIIEVNPRSSRTVPFLSKSTGYSLADIATEVILGKSLKEQGLFDLYPDEKKRHYVKVPVFSWNKIKGLDAYLSPEMKSTGEAIGYDDKLSRAMYKALQASGMKLQNYGTVLVTVAREDREEALPLVRRFYDMGFNIEATPGTASFLKEHGIRTRVRHKISEGSDEILDSIRAGYVSYIINTRAVHSGRHLEDGVIIRRCATENNVTIFTSLDTVRVLLDVLEETTITVSTIDS